MTTIVKATTKGQITLPVRWRKQHATDRFVVEEKGGSLQIRPVHLDRLMDEYTVFDALRDNKGKGVKASDLARILREMDG